MQYKQGEIMEILDTDMQNLYDALSKAQGEIKNPIKNKKNPFHKNMYADLASHIDCVKEVFCKYGLSIIHITRIDNGLILCKTSIHHQNGQSISTEIPLGNVTLKGDLTIGMQAIGSALTYAKRYNIAGLCNLAGEDDDDAETIEAPQRNGNHNQSKAALHSDKPMNNEQVLQMISAYDQLSKERQENYMKYILTTYKADAFNKIPESEFSRLMNLLTKKVE
jgi:ERF superfamily